MTTPIHETLNYLLVQVCKAHRQKASTLLSQVELYAGQEMLLLKLWAKDGLMQSEMADELCVQPATITKMLDRMVESGLVERRKDPDDQRVSRIYLTAKGIALQEPVADVWQQFENQATADFTLEEKILLRRLLLQLQKNLAE